MPTQMPPDEKAFDRHVVIHLKNFARTIDVTKFINVYGWSIDKTIDMYQEVLWNNPDIFYVERFVKIAFVKRKNGTVAFAKFTHIRYAINHRQFQICKERLDREVKKAVKFASSGKNEAEIALRLHDYIIRICDYDTDALKVKDHTPLARTVYSVLVRKKAVCEGYTMAYRYLLKKFNIRCEEIVSHEMQHCWNYICLNNKWYHVDITFDDPVFVDDNGDQMHLSEEDMKIIEQHDHTQFRRNFLMSDAKARKTGHHDWLLKGLPPASDTSYDHVHFDALDFCKESE